MNGRTQPHLVGALPRKASSHSLWISCSCCLHSQQVTALEPAKEVTVLVIFTAVGLRERESESRFVTFRSI